MKALKIALICTAAALSVAAASVSACHKAVSGTFEGEYKYDNPYAEGTYYGVKVSVEVEEDVIKSVTVLDSEYIQASDSYEEWGWDNTVYQNGRDNLLASYAGKTVDDILALSVAVDEDGAPYVSTDRNFVSYDSDLLISGATQSSGRMLLAVKNALENA
ncbi:MAG: hypothetical protein LUI60_04820 [Clostridia bacterium]|nr:hypothetical protein [Clostridia bacterium]